MSLSPLAIDIETVGLEWEKLDEEVRTYLLNRGKKGATKEEAVEHLSLSPGTGRIISIGMWRPKEEKGGVLLESSEDGDKPVEWAELAEETMIYRGSESEILTEFWR
ncbi:MAG: 3'-5' exonuclease, partial [Candidatus Bipolaricaulia bacterium]